MLLLLLLLLVAVDLQHQRVRIWPAISIRSLRKGEKGEARPAVVLLNNGLLIYEKDQIYNKLILLYDHVIG